MSPTWRHSETEEDGAAGARACGSGQDIHAGAAGRAARANGAILHPPCTTPLAGRLHAHTHTVTAWPGGTTCRPQQAASIDQQSATGALISHSLHAAARCATERSATQRHARNSAATTAPRPVSQPVPTGPPKRPRPAPCPPNPHSTAVASSPPPPPRARPPLPLPRRVAPAPGRTSWGTL